MTYKHNICHFFLVFQHFFNHPKLLVIASRAKFPIGHNRGMNECLGDLPKAVCHLNFRSTFISNLCSCVIVNTLSLSISTSHSAGKLVCMWSCLCPLPFFCGQIWGVNTHVLYQVSKVNCFWFDTFSCGVSPWVTSVFTICAKDVYRNFLRYIANITTEMSLHVY